ncbi:MAG: cobalamin biosynthesis protein [Synechococcales cyanobacterium M58_A2018_015]|nr:cobalamin biosynthesis protein [Synechococcales cyanobacterium M58_A2018_015]
MPFIYSAAVLGVAALLDFWIGDPWNWLHPVQVMGWWINSYTQVAFKRLQHPVALRWAGVGLTLSTIGLTVGISGLLVWTARFLHPGLGVVTESALLASCFAGRSLRDAAHDVLRPLAACDLVAARTHLSRYVGRDTAALSELEIRRAVLETVSENAVDGVLAPLFYALIGALLPLGSAPLALGYKALSTLDSMVGYREAPYTELGWCSARLEDGVTWLPCRLTVITLAFLSGRPRAVWRICCRDAPQDPSPNSGWSECVYAAILGVQVGGANSYRGIVKQKPLLGDPLKPITSTSIEQALDLTRRCFLLWLVMGLVMGWTGLLLQAVLSATFS